MQDHTFDPEFSMKVRALFADRFRVVQYDSALRLLKLIYKDVQFVEVGCQALEGDIDNDLIEKVTFYKKETVRLQGEINQMRYKMMQNEKMVKLAAKEKKDALVTIAALEKTLKESRSENARNTSLQMQYRQMHQKAQAESDTLIIEVRKQGTTIARLKRNDLKAENLINLFMLIGDRKNVLIKDFAALVDKFFDSASPEYKKRIEAVRHLRKKVDSKNDELRKTILDYQKRNHTG